MQIQELEIKRIQARIKKLKANLKNKNLNSKKREKYRKIIVSAKRNILDILQLKEALLQTELSEAIYLPKE